MRVSSTNENSDESTRKEPFPVPFMYQDALKIAGYGVLLLFWTDLWATFRSRLTHLTRKDGPSPSIYGTLPYLRHAFLWLSMHRAHTRGCEDTNLVLNWEKCHFMVKEGIVLGHKISKSGIEVDRTKVDVIAKLPHPTTVKGICSFLGHAGFYR
ncbi:hypothetical protein Tco_0559236 [Tanacetum coccineum]